MALQFGPQILLMPVTGFAADHLNRRNLLLATQAAMGVLALGLGLLTIFGWVQLWHVYTFALLLGCITAFDTPARQTFVVELVNEADLPNAVGLNSTSFNAARLIGPAIAGVLIAGVGSGWVFLINAASFGAVLCSLCFLKTETPRAKSRTVGGWIRSGRSSRSRTRATSSYPSVGQLCLLRDRMHASRRYADLLVLWSRACWGRHLGADLHHHRE